MRALVSGLALALLGLTLTWVAVLAVVIAFRLEPGDDVPHAMFWLPGLVLGLWTGCTTRGSRRRLQMAWLSWLVLLGLFLVPTLIGGAGWDRDLAWLLPTLAVALATSWLARGPLVRWSAGPPPGGGSGSGSGGA